MPPKEKEKEVAPPPEPSIDDLLTAVAEDSTAERHICEIIDELITATEEEVRLKRIRNAGVAHTVTGIMSDITVVLKCYFNECDPESRKYVMRLDGCLMWSQDLRRLTRGHGVLCLQNVVMLFLQLRPSAVARQRLLVLEATPRGLEELTPSEEDPTNLGAPAVPNCQGRRCMWKN